MKSRLFEFFLLSVQSTMLLYGFGVAFASLFAPVVQDDISPAGIPGVAFGLALFGIPLIGPIAICAGIAVTLSVSFRKFTFLHVLLLVLIATAAGLAASWLFQYVGPFELYHEADGRVPRGVAPWEKTVRMSSSTTVLALWASFCAVSISAFLCRRAARQCFSVPA